MNKEKISETVVAVVPKTTLPAEKQMTEEVVGIEAQAEELIIETDQDYENAAAFGKMLKQKMADVQEFFKPMKESAHKAHKAVCDREKTMLNPLNKAEKILKQGMSHYLAEKEATRKRAEELARKAAAEERERLLAEADKMEAAGDSEAAEVAMQDAIVMDQAVDNSVTALPVTKKVSGVATSKDWEIVSIDDKKVPISVGTTVIRPVDTKAVIRLIRESKGTTNIPGVVYREVSKLSFRK